MARFENKQVKKGKPKEENSNKKKQLCHFFSAFVFLYYYYFYFFLQPNWLATFLPTIKVVDIRILNKIISQQELTMKISRKA